MRPPRPAERPRDTDAVPFPLPTAVTHDGRRYDVAVRVSFDGVEYVGRLWFRDPGGQDLAGVPDRGVVPGRTLEEAVDLARRFTPDELRRRLQRALAEKRRFRELRAATDEILARVRYVNRVAVAARSGVLESEGAAQELDLAEAELHDLVRQLKTVAGVEGGE